LDGDFEDPPISSTKLTDDAADRTSAPLTSFGSREYKVIRSESGHPEDDILRRCIAVIEYSER